MSSFGAAPARSSLRPVLGATLLFLLALLVLGGLKGYRDLRLARERVYELEESIRAAEGRIEALELEIELLRSDPNTLERHAREDLGLARPGELVILLPEPAAPQPPIPLRQRPSSGPD